MANEPAVLVLDHFARVCGDLEKLLMNFLLIGIFFFRFDVVYAGVLLSAVLHR